MPAYNAARYVRQAIESVLAQEGVSFELIVLDDGSTDDTAAIVGGMRDPRLALLRNERRRGIGACHNRILRRTHAEFLAQVDADDVLLPGALQAMVQALEGNPEAALAHCYFFDVDAEGRTSLNAFIARWESFRRTRPVGMDYRARLSKSNVANALRTYRRTIFEEVGAFDESLRFGVDYDMALRIAERHTIVLVPRFLYVRRVHGANTSEAARWKALHFWRQTNRIKRSLIERGVATFLSVSRFDFAAFLWRVLGDAAGGIRAAAARHVRRWGTMLRGRFVAPAATRLYESIVDACPRWPRPPSAPRSSPGCGRVAYYTSVFPALSETFIQREVLALREAGVGVSTIARISGEGSQFDASARDLREQTHYVEGLDPNQLAGYRRRFLRKHPKLLLQTFAYLLFHRYTPLKSLAGDREVFDRVIAVAGTARDAGVTRIHSPWATTDGLVAMLAARLIGVPYTVQARASDLYKTSTTFDIGERLAGAATIVTNARYNLEAIRAAVQDRPCPPIVQIYEGVDLEQLVPPAQRRHDGPEVRLLCVARLTAPKGIEHLLQAVREVIDAGVKVRCEVAGGRLSAEANYYLRLQALRRDLGLEEEVCWLGAMPFQAIVEKYREADVFVLPAVQAADGRRDVTPNSIIEAMAMELPVVSSRSGAIPELVDDEVDGILVPPGDAPAVAAAIVRLARDPDLCRRLGKAARRKVEERFDLRRNVRHYVELFRN